MKYPDFIVSKTVPTAPQEDRFKHILAIVEIKRSDANPLFALSQLVDYTMNAEQMGHAQIPTSGALPSYLLLGLKYTWLEIWSGYGIWPKGYQAAPWQYVFEHLDLDAGTAPFMYRMCDLAVCHWNLV